MKKTIKKKNVQKKLLRQKKKAGDAVGKIYKQWIKIDEFFKNQTGYHISQIIKFILIGSVISIVVLNILSVTNNKCEKKDKCIIDCTHEVEKKDSEQNCQYYTYQHKILYYIRNGVNILLILFFSYYIRKYKSLLFIDDNIATPKQMVQSLMIYVFMIKIFLDFSNLIIPVCIQIYEIVIKPIIS